MEIMSVKGLTKKLTIKAHGNIFTFLLFLLPTFKGDLILSSYWLKTIGPHISNYGELHLKFLYNDKFKVLQGEVDNNNYMLNYQNVILWLKR